MNEIGILSIEKELLNEIDYKKIINNLTSNKTRKVYYN